MTNREPLWAVFERCAREVLSRESGLRHIWIPGADKIRLVIPKQDETGFTVEVHAERYGLYVFAEGWHGAAWEVRRSESAEQLCAQFLGFIRTLLSPDAWLEVRYAGRSPYKWLMWYGVEGGLESEATGLLLFNYLGRRATQVLQNRHLPARYGVKSVG